MSFVSNPSPWRRLYPGEYETRGVPHSLRRAVQVLNEALAIDRAVFSKVLNTAVAVSLETAKKVIDHPSIVLGSLDSNGEVDAMSALGLLNGIFMTSRFRLCGWMYDDGDGDASGNYEEFYILEDTTAKDTPVDGESPTAIDLTTQLEDVRKQ